MLLFAAALLTILTACDIPMGGDEYDPPATEIVDVRAEPNPIAVGDTATFTCVVERNVAGLDFAWNPPGIGNTTTNRYRWVVSVPPDSYQVVVAIRRTGFEKVQSGARFTVVAKE